MTHQSPTDESRKSGIEFGWRTHSTITDWTAKVDSKASMVLSLGGVLLGFFVALSAAHRLFADLHGWRLAAERLGIGSVSLGVFLAALVVAPRLNRRQSKRIWRDHFVYFGHLRHWQPKDLKKRLENLDADKELEVLSLQLVATSKIAWFKHSLLQWAMFALLGGVLVVVVSIVWPR
jgi:hypothetical protein